MIIYDAVILGAGASGLVCACQAASVGLHVLVIDHADKAGCKLAVTGGGKCNFTNRNITARDYIGENPDFSRSALAAFSPQHAISMMEEAGIPIEEREHGQIFCTRPAAEFVRFLAGRCKAAGCVFAFGEKVVALEKAHASAGSFTIRTVRGAYLARNVVIALGGVAWPQVGATGSGFELARKFGHRIVPIRPALAGLVMQEGWPLAGLQGIALPASIDILPRGAEAVPKKGGSRRAQGGAGGRLVAEALSLLFTHRGISGPAALQASLYWRKGDGLSVDFLPSGDIRALLNEPCAGKLLARNFLKKHLPDRLAELLCPAEAADIKCASLPRAVRETLHARVHAFPMRPAGTEGFTRAEVTAGGVSTDEVSSRDMQSRREPGLFFCGEVLDVTGRLGGYNLHWAFASGLAAGKALAETATPGRASFAEPART